MSAKKIIITITPINTIKYGVNSPVTPVASTIFRNIFVAIACPSQIPNPASTAIVTLISVATVIFVFICFVLVIITTPQSFLFIFYYNHHAFDTDTFDTEK